MNEKPITATEIMERWKVRTKEVHDFIYQPDKPLPPEIAKIMEKKDNLSIDEILALSKNVMQDMAEIYVRINALDSYFAQQWENDKQRFINLTNGAPK